MKKIVAVLFVVAVLLVSVSLSEEAVPADASEGSRLIGLLITREDLSDYANESGVVFASCTQKEPDDEPDYLFGDVSGLRLICFIDIEENGEGSRIISNVDDGISSVDFDMNEDGSFIKMDAAICFVPGQDEELFFYNPVLRTDSGQVFAVAGDFMAVSAAMNPPGSSVGQTVRDERKHTENGRETSDTTTVSIQIRTVRKPMKIRLLQFNAGHELLESEEFDPGTVPDQVVPLAETEYLLLETVEKDPDGSTFTRREVIGRDMDFLNTLSCRDDGICLCHYHEVLWKTTAPEEESLFTGYPASGESSPDPAASQDIPQNGIPLLILRIDESEDTIAKASENDPKHEYGTIEQMHESALHTVRCVGDLQLLVPDGYEGEYGSSSVPSGPVELKYIRGRGNMSWGMSEKKSYKIEFDDAQDFFGMGASTDWALMSNSQDSSFLRNRITYWLGEQIGLDFSVQQIPVDVVMTGSISGRHYLGSYTLCETVKIDEGRVNIPKLKKNVKSEDPNETPNITGGYLLSCYSEMQDSDKPENTVFAADSGLKWMSRTPEYDDGELTAGQNMQRKYISNFMKKLDDLIVQSETIDEATHLQIAEMMDMKSAADYWWIQTFTYNTDAFSTSSTYMYKTPDTASGKGKLYWGPLWDFDGGYEVGNDTELGAATGLNNAKDIWFDQLRDKDPLFVELLRERWQDPEDGMNVKLTEITREGGLLDQYSSEIRASWEANELEWFADLDPEYLYSMDECVEVIRKWIDARREWTDHHLDSLNQVYFRITYMADGQEVASGTARGRESIIAKYIPDAPEKEGYVFTGWQEKESGESILGFMIDTDTVFVAAYLDRNEIVEPEAIRFSVSEDQISLDRELYWLRYEVFPEGAMTGKISWASSDPDVVLADSEFLELKGTGDATVTATLWNGVSAAFNLRVTEPETTVSDE